ncbi:MAG: NADH:ubiquinone oxidoreductase [Bacteroidales bacterium]|nr:NADH:ubiquinone oxidoreductase [Bacteroidales bacterium]
MLKEVKALVHHGYQAVKNLRTQPVSPLFRGRPEISGDLSENDIADLSRLCPVSAIDEKTGAIDLGKCVFCRECEFLKPGKIRFTNDYKIASNNRNSIIIQPGSTEPVKYDESLLRKEIREMFHGSLKLRQVSAGGDNSCEMELAAAGNVNFDMGRFGIEFVASPRHADGIVITGPVSANMADALKLTLEAVPEPRIIILTGTDAISGGIFAESPAIDRSFIEKYHVDLFVPGNPAHPLTFINGVMDMLAMK